MQLPDVAGFRFQKTSQGIEQPQRGLAINRANVGASLVGKDNALSHRYARSLAGGVSAIFRKSSIVSPKSARTSSIGT